MAKGKRQKANVRARARFFAALRMTALLGFVSIPILGFGVGPALTTITGQLFTAQAQPLSARVQILNGAFISPDGHRVDAGSVVVQAPGGVLTVSLVPTVGAVPVGTTYAVVITTSEGVEENDTWSVPVSATPVDIDTVSGMAQNCVFALPTLAAGGGLSGMYPNPTVNVSAPLLSGPSAISIPQASASQDGYLSAADWSAFHSGEAVSVSSPLSNNGGTISIPAASSSQDGYLSSTDWSTFNGKQAALPAADSSHNGYLTSTDWSAFNAKQAALSFSGPLSNNAGTVSIPAASSSANGYLSSTDWSTFNGKQAALPAADSSHNGYLTSTDWSAFNGKQAALGFTPENAANKNQANGYAGLDSSGLLKAAQIPALSVSVTASSAGNQTVAHGLGRTPVSATIEPTSACAWWWQATPWDGTNLYPVASDALCTAKVIVW